VSSKPVALHPRRGFFGHAVAAYRKAELDQALSLLHGNDDVRAVILRARCLLRLGRASAAVEELRDVSIDPGDALARAEVNVLTANAVARLNAPDLEDALHDAELAVREVSSANLRTELSWVKMRTAWARGDLDQADKFASDALAVERDDGTSAAHLFHTRALVLDLLGLIASDREQFDVAAVRFREALAEVDGAPIADEWIVAFTTANIATLARDFPWAADAQFLTERIDRVRWVPSIASRRYFCLHGLGWCHAHQGNHVGALRAFHDAADVAPSKPLRIGAWVDHALLGRELGAGFVAEESARYAADLSADVKWDTVRDGERFALLFLAEALAPVDVTLARSALNRYDASRSFVDTIGSGDANPINVRGRAFEYRAEAEVARAEGLIPRARALFRQEYEIWRRIGSEPRAAVAALDAYELDRDPLLLAFARTAAASTPLSWIARRVAGTVESPQR
jgi:tetratricopeptide (TPR) repeat protein